MIEKRYILDRKTFEIKEAYIEPDKEWCQVKSGENWRKIYNDIDPGTGKRTGHYYYADDVFCSVEEGKEGLRTHLRGLIEHNRERMEKLEDRNNKLTNILMSV